MKIGKWKGKSAVPLTCSSVKRKNGRRSVPCSEASYETSSASSNVRKTAARRGSAIECTFASSRRTTQKKRERC